VLNGVFAILVVGAVLTAAFNGTMPQVSNASMASAKSAVELAIGLVGQMALWLGFMSILREAGLMQSLARALRPIMCRLFPDVPPDHPAMGAMIMNLGANLLGLSNAATPFGLKAIAELNTLNKRPGVATNAMALFLAINTAGLTLIPAPAVAVRAAMGSHSPGAIIAPSLLASSVTCLSAILFAKLLQGVRAFSLDGYTLEGATPEPALCPAPSGEAQEPEPAAPTHGARLAVVVTVAVAVVLTYAVARKLWLAQPAQRWEVRRGLLSDWLIPLVMSAIVLVGVGRRVKVYETFVQAAKEGFQVAVNVIPFLVAILVGVGMFRASGALEALIRFLGPATSRVGFPPEALPMALMRPLSGSGALAVMTDTLKAYGPDGFIGNLVSVMNGTSETTFYVLAVYFGSVHVRSIRHTLIACLTADFCGVVAATVVCRLFFLR
jgi:spore maturation protein SpmA